MVGWFRCVCPPPSAGLCPFFPSSSAFLFPCPFRVCPSWARCVGVGVFLGSSSLFCVPRLLFRLSNFQLIFIFISFSSPFILIFIAQSGPQLQAPLLRGVCEKHLNRCKTSSCFATKLFYSIPFISVSRRGQSHVCS